MVVAPLEVELEPEDGLIVASLVVQVPIGALEEPTEGPPEAKSKFLEKPSIGHP